MPDESKCPQCGTPINAGALTGLCPACLLKRGAETEGNSGAFTPPSIAELAAAFPALEILEMIGRGGMGAVYKARQTQLDRVVALKILPSNTRHDAAFASRFAREAKALARLNHPGIVTLFEFGRTADGLYYFLMEFVDGLNLRQLLTAERMSAREALAIVPQICDALQFAHDQGIVHRDIKPENILLDRRGRVKVADFGLAKLVGHRSEPVDDGKGVLGAADLTAVGKVMGTPNYMAPEQVLNPGEVDHRADIYALGVVFYQMLTGELPGKNLEPPSRKVQIDVRLDAVVLRALEKDPEHRYAQASVLKTQVETIATVEEIRNVADTRLSAFTLWARAAFGLFLVGVVLWIGWAAYEVGIFKRESPEESREAGDRGSGAGTTEAAAVLVERWSPNSDKPDLSKVLSEAEELTTSRQYEDALQRLQWYYQHAQEYDRSVSGTRNSSVLSRWEELGRRYPKARLALRAVRDARAREFTAGRGYFELFMDVANINRTLQDEDATFELFLAIREGDRALARQCYFAAESLLVERGEYALCYEYFGDPQARFNTIVSLLMDKTMENRDHASFVEKSCRLIEILVGSGHREEAVKIQEQALSLVNHPTLKSALDDAARKAASPRRPHPSPVHYKVTPQATINTAGASQESWTPPVTPGEKPEPDKIYREAKELMTAGRYEDALQRHLWYHHHALEYRTDLTGVRLSFVLSDWVELGRRYPKARQAMLEIRDRDTREFLEGRGYVELFRDVASINKYLEQEDATHRLFKTLHDNDPRLAAQCYRTAASVLVRKGEYALCLRYVGDPEKAFRSLQGTWERMRAEEKKRAETNARTRPQNEAPSMADRHFVEGTVQLITILAGANLQGEAQRISDLAMQMVDDPRLLSAVNGQQQEKAR